MTVSGVGRAGLTVRAEDADDIEEIRRVVFAAFGTKSHLNHREASIIDALRSANALPVSLVADSQGGIVGHIAASLVNIDGKASKWYGLGPVSVLPSHQGQGIGSLLVKASLEHLDYAWNAAGCVVAGKPQYYSRFGFQRNASLTFDGAPAKLFQHIVLHGPPASGEVTYHEAFNVNDH